MSGLRRVRWPAIALIAALFAGALFVSRQQEKALNYSDQQAAVIAREQVDFVPTKTAVKMVRQGVPSTPHWAVSMTSPEGEVVTVVVSASTGQVTQVNRGRR